MGIYAVTECLQDFFLGLTGLLDYPSGFSRSLIEDEGRMEMGEIIEDVPGRPLDAMPFHAQFESPQIGQGDNATQEMAPDLTVGPMVDGTDAHGRVALAETPLHFPPVEIGFDDIGGCPVRVVRDDDGPAEGLPLLLHGIDVLPEPHGELAIDLFEGEFVVRRREVQFLT